MRRVREAEEARRRDEAKGKALEIWSKARPALDDHPYLIHKRIKAPGARLHSNALVIPVRDDSELHSLQFIEPDGQKQFLSGGRVAGCRFVIGNPKGAAALCIAEGFATASTIYEATNYPVVVAFNASNLKAVARAMREKLPDADLILCADDDTVTNGNPGLTKATEAARAVNGKLAVPDFSGVRPAGATDFNDMAAICGAEAVKRAIDGASEVNQESNSQRPGWAEPLRLVTKVEPQPYPLDALPETVRAAVVEVRAFVKAPLPLIAMSALSALSLACQAHIDVRRDEILVGPVGLFLLTIAESGERKTQADKMFLHAVVDYQDQQRETAKPDQEAHRAAIIAWETKRAGLLEAIKQAAKRGNETSELEASLGVLEREKPKPRRVPKLIREDATPEGLAKKLQNEWPSAGVISNEAGIVFGAHGMGKDSVMRNLGLLNKLWDGGRFQSDRGDEARDRFVRGARLTMGLMVQGATLRAFFDQLKGLARGSGFLARFLVAWRESTMGTRFYTEPQGNPALSAFNRRISAILNQSVAIDDDGHYHRLCCR